MKRINFILPLLLLLFFVPLASTQTVADLNYWEKNVDSTGVKIGTEKIKLGMPLTEAEKIMNSNSWQQFNISLYDQIWQKNKDLRITLNIGKETIRQISIAVLLSGNESKAYDLAEKLNKKYRQIKCEVGGGINFFLIINIGN